MKLDVLPSSTTTDAWYADGLRFTCSQCGNCCTGGPGFVWITKEEIVKLAAMLKLTPQETVERYCRKIDGQFSLREKRGPGGAYDCIFLQEEETTRRTTRADGTDETIVHTKRICSVYAARPLQCRTWPFWPEILSSKSVWDHAARKCHGMNVGRKFSLPQIHAIRDAAAWPKHPPAADPKKPRP